jgi:glyoxylase-like metal-dependent hydrolase (beta-lactamase superfamily II)
MDTDVRAYEVFALQYAEREGRRSAEFFKYEMYGEPDGPQAMAYYFWLIRNQSRTILLDCAYNRERAAARGRFMRRHPVDLLATMGVRPEDVDDVVVSHMHFDHVGNLDLFPNATVSIARQEYDFWTGPYGQRSLMSHFVLAEDLASLHAVQDSGRLRVIDAPCDIAPGVRALLVGGHTPGQLIVEVACKSGPLVLASDTIHFYEEMELDRPFSLFINLETVYRSLEVLRDYQARGIPVIPGHDPKVGEQYKAVAEDCFDLTARTN